MLPSTCTRLAYSPLHVTPSSVQCIATLPIHPFLAISSLPRSPPSSPRCPFLAITAYCLCSSHLCAFLPLVPAHLYIFFLYPSVPSQPLNSSLLFAASCMVKQTQPFLHQIALLPRPASQASVKHIKIFIETFHFPLLPLLPTQLPIALLILCYIYR